MVRFQTSQWVGPSPQGISKIAHSRVAAIFIIRIITTIIATIAIAII
jgi:hypothetical protein